MEGANVNFTFSGHDEYLTVREVYSILHPLSFKHFIMAIISGDVLYYGRIVFYIDALFAFIPYKIWGLEGMVYAIRMTHVLELLFGVLLLSHFIKSNAGKVFFIFNVLILYYTAYFVMIPKPEPLQLLLLAVFLLKASKVDWQFGWHFIWLGMAYGAKFNVLTVLPLFFLLPYFHGYRKMIGSFKSILAFLIGVFIAIPSLILTPIKPIFFQTYLNNTFGRTNHYDDTVISFLEWVKTGWLGSYNGGLWLGLAFLALIIWSLFLGLKKYWQIKIISSQMVLLMVGLGFLLPVMLFTGRMWPHYLWTGQIFLILAIAVNLINIQTRLFFLALMSIVTMGSVYSTINQGSHLFSLQSQSKQLIEDSKKAHNYLLMKSKHMICAQDISVYYPFKEMLEVNPYHPFANKLPKQENQYQIIWIDFVNPKKLNEMGADYLITNKYNFNQNKTSSATEKDRLIEKDNSLMREELGKSILLDSMIGNLKIYKIIRE